MIRIFLVFLIVLASSCASAPKHPTAIYQAYDGAELGSDSVASILMVVRSDLRDYVDWVQIDNTTIDHDEYGEIRIPPGTYVFEWGRKFPVSPMVKLSGSEKRQWSTNVTLEAGHVYTIHAKRTVGPGYRIYSWITDDSRNEVIWGKKYTPGPYDQLLK